MSEPEELIVEAAHFATTRARALWASRRAGDARLHLSDVRRRLELFAAALFPDTPPIGPAEPPPPLPLLARFASPLAPRARHTVALPSTDGVRLRLPDALDEPGADASIRRYRLLALGQAVRAARGTPGAVPTDDLLVRDLFLLAEAAAADATLAALLPGLRAEFAAARAQALASRAGAGMSAQESAVERLTALLLAADPMAPPAPIPRCDSPVDSLAWAAARSRAIGALPGRYRGVAPVPLWGTVAPPPDAAPAAGPAGEPDANAHRRPPRTHTMRRRPRVRAAADDEDDERTGTWIVRADDPQESVEDPMGLQRPADHDHDADPADLGDSLSDLHEARLVRTPEAPHEVLASGEPLPRSSVSADQAATRSAIAYPEWDYREQRYRTRGAVVREVAPTRTDAAWAEQVLGRRRSLVRRVRRDFERLRPRRELVRRQVDGTDVDVDAYVTTAADGRAGVSPDERLYIADRRTRRDVAVVLLVDISASTDAWVAGSRRVIDVEREGLLIVGEALAALGDPHAVYAFRGQGAGSVELLPLKRFTESPSAAVRGRIGGLEPDGYTRVGAAVRHATALVARVPARQRLLLLLSDGRPNDVDAYEGRYGVEDTRQAVVEAQAQGVHSFCLTVDREAPSYATRIFGHGGYAALHHPERLPQVLVGVLRRLLRD